VATLGVACASTGAHLTATNAGTSCANTVSADSTVYDTAAVTERPVRRGGPPPTYPATARMNRMQGRVVVVAVIEPSGRASSVVVANSVDVELDAEAVKVVRSSVYWPGCRAGAAVRVKMRIPIDFALREY